MNPPYQARFTVAINRPRRWAGENSDIIGQPTEYSAPIATPIKNRMTINASAELVKNWASEATTNREMSIMNKGLRPHLSDAQPPNGEPIKIPNNAIDATRPI